MFNVDATMMLEDELHSELNNDRENMIDINVNSILNSTAFRIWYGPFVDHFLTNDDAN
jgi:hypothetical protein